MLDLQLLNLGVMVPNRAWILTALVTAFILVVSIYVTFGGISGLERDPAETSLTIGILVLITVPTMWFSYRKAHRQLRSGGEANSQEFIPETSFPVVVADASALPYEVKYRGLDLAGIVFDCFLGLAAAVLGFASGFGIHASELVLTLLRLALFTLAAVSLYRLWLLREPWLVLYADRLETRSLMGRQSLSRDQIKGLKAAGADRKGRVFEVVPTDSRISGIRIRQELRDDPVVSRWFRGAADLTADAIAADKSEISGDPRYGVTPLERMERLKYARVVTAIFSVGCVAAAAWFYVHPKPYLWALVAALIAPLLSAALVFGSNGLIVWWSTSKVRPPAIAGFAPAIAVIVGPATRLHLLNYASLCWIAAALGVIAAAIAYVNFARGPRAALLIGICMGISAYDLGAFADVALDQSAARTFPATIEDKEFTGGRSRTYNLYVSPWADQPGGPLSVSSEFYAQVQRGAIICISLRTGAIGFPWTDIDYCPRQTGAPNSPT